MGKFSKWIGGGLGWVFGGPLGAIAGFIIGSIIDSSELKTYSSKRGYSRTTTPGGFIISLLVLVAAVMKADGKITKQELEYVKRFFVRSFGTEAAKDAILMLRDLLKQNIPIDDVCRQIYVNMNHPTRLQLLNFLCGIANVDKSQNKAEYILLQDIARKLGLTSEEFKAAYSMYVEDDNWAYEMLEITRDATDEEVKKAYKKMAVKLHPDKIEYLGEDFKKAAKEKFQKLNQAYEKIKKERNMH